MIARETIAALRKYVTANCYGRDISRNKKLLDKQKKGRTRMREHSKVSIPQVAFIAALRIGQRQGKLRLPYLSTVRKLDRSAKGDFPILLQVPRCDQERIHIEN